MSELTLKDQPSLADFQDYVKEEIADMLIYLCAIANRLDIDIEQAFREKEEVNKKREWI